MLAQGVATVAEVQVAVVFDPLQAKRPRMIQQIGPRHAQQRPQLCGPPIRPALHLGHRRQALRSGAAQQLQQERFGLVVLLVGCEQEIRVQAAKDAQALAPRGRLDAGGIVARNLHPVSGQINGMRSTEAGAEIGPVVGVGRQAMVHVHRPQVEGMPVAQRHQRMQQRDRIEPSRKCQHQVRAGRSVAGKTVRHGCDDGITWQGLP